MGWLINWSIPNWQGDSWNLLQKSFSGQGVTLLFEDQVIVLGLGLGLDIARFWTSTKRLLCIFLLQQDDTGLFKESKATSQPKKPDVKPPPASQPSKSKSGGGLFSDEDEEEGGGLFGAPAAKPQPKAEVKSRPKTKTTISLFDDDEQDEEDDFFVAPAASKANR